MQDIEKPGASLIIRPEIQQLKDRLTRNEPVDQIIRSVLETDYQILYPLQFTDFTGDLTRDLPHSLVNLYEVEPQAIARNFDFINGFKVSMQWWDAYLRDLEEVRGSENSVRNNSGQKHPARIRWLRESQGERWLGAEYLIKRWEEAVSPENYPADPNAVRAIIRGVNKLYQQITGNTPPEIRDISEPVHEEFPLFVYMFRPVEMGGVKEAELLTKFFQAIEKGDPKVILPQLLKDKFITAREQAQTLTPDVPEKGFRLLNKAQGWYTDGDYLVGSVADEIDFRKFPLPEDYELRATIHLHASNRAKDGSEGSNYLSDADLAIIAENVEGKWPVVNGAICIGVMVIAVATEETRQRVIHSFPARIVGGYARHELNRFLHQPQVQTLETAKKRMNLSLAKKLKLNLYFWDYTDDYIIRAKEPGVHLKN